MRMESDAAAIAIRYSLHQIYSWTVPEKKPTIRKIIKRNDIIGKQNLKLLIYYTLLHNRPIRRYRWYMSTVII